MGYAWPGNVRELQHAIEFAVIRSRNPTLEPQDFPPEILHQEDHAVVKPHKPVPDSEKDAAILQAWKKPEAISRPPPSSWA